MQLLFFIVGFLASSIGSICGIGGGIVIKPVLDLAVPASVSAIGFYSCCTVLAMSGYNVVLTLRDRSGAIERGAGTVLAIGAAVGGVLGNRLFTALKETVGRDGVVGATQSALLLLLTLGTLVYTLRKDRIRCRRTGNAAASLPIGLALGGVSSFLGIGGGPFNLVVLHYFFGMDTKRAVQNSLYVILFSQVANLLMSLVGNHLQEVKLPALLLMMAGGIGGGIVGRMANRRFSNTMVDRLFIGLLATIVLLCVYNAIRYLRG